jgi:hypothetical protein
MTLFIREFECSAVLKENVLRFEEGPAEAAKPFNSCGEFGFGTAKVIPVSCR